ncbi:P1 family peptidase [Clostridiaceae bacterium 35-E11]
MFKGSTGTSSRVVAIEGESYILEVLVQANHGFREHFEILGVKMGDKIKDCDPVYNTFMPKPGTGSIIVVVATNAPMMPWQLSKVCKRVPIGIGKLRADYENGSGDIFIAFSTANENAFTTTKTSVEILGDALSIFCAVFYSFMVIIIVRYANEVDNIIMSIGQLATATILSALGLFIWEPLNTTQIMDNWFPILFVGIFATALIIPLQISAQKYTSPTKVGIFVLLEPVVGTILAVIFINEILTKNSQIGCVLILLGLLMIKYEEYIKEKKSTNKTQLHC